MNTVACRSLNTLIHFAAYCCMSAQPRQMTYIAVECIPLGQLIGEGFPILVATRRAGDDLNGRLRISVGCLAAAVVDLEVVNGPQASVEMLMGKELHIDTMLIEQILQTEPLETGQTLPYVCLQIAIAVVLLVIAAIHRPMAVGDDPRTLGTILGQIGLGQITFQPVELLR